MDKKASTYLSYVAANLRQLKRAFSSVSTSPRSNRVLIPSDRSKPLPDTSRTYFVGLKFRSYRFSPFEELCSAVLFIAGLEEVERSKKRPARYLRLN
jgi:hypothetical protein